MTMKRVKGILLHDCQTELWNIDYEGIWHPFGHKAGAIKIPKEWYTRIRLLLNSEPYLTGWDQNGWALEKGMARHEFPEQNDSVAEFEYSTSEVWNNNEVWAEVVSANVLELEMIETDTDGITCKNRITYCGSFTVWWLD